MARKTRIAPRGLNQNRRRRLSRNEKIGVASLATLVAVGALGVVAGLMLDRLLDFDDALDAGGEWDEGGGVYTRWM